MYKRSSDGGIGRREGLKIPWPVMVVRVRSSLGAPKIANEVPTTMFGVILLRAIIYCPAVWRSHKRFWFFWRRFDSFRDNTIEVIWKRVSSNIAALIIHPSNPEGCDGAGTGSFCKLPKAAGRINRSRCAVRLNLCTGVYLLCLISSRKSSWLHVGSNPISPTKYTTSYIWIHIK